MRTYHYLARHVRRSPALKHTLESIGVSRLARLTAHWVTLLVGTYELPFDGHTIQFVVSGRTEILRLDNTPLENEVIRQLCMRCGEPDDLLFDVGANIGVVSICTAVSNPSLHVHAFEPVPSNAAAMRANVSANRMDSRVVVHTKAISSAEGPASIFAGHSVGDGHASLISPQRPDDHSLEIYTTTLDAMARAIGCEPTVVKIDVEGAELGVIAGMSHLARTGSRLHSILIELHPKALRAIGHSVDDVITPLLRTGFCVAWRQSRGSELHYLLTRSQHHHLG